MADLSRREFAALAGAAAAAPFVCARDVSGAAAITAEEVIERIRKNIGVEWKPDSVDTREGRRSVHHRHGDRDHLDGDAGRAPAGREGRRQHRHHRTADVLRAGPTCRRRPPAAERRIQRGSASRSRVHREARVHHQEQPRRLPPERPLATAPARSARAGPRDRARLVEVSVRRRSAALRDSCAHARRAGEPCEETRCGREAASASSAIPQPRCGGSALLPGTTPIQAALKMLPNVDVIVAGEVREWEIGRVREGQGVRRREERPDSRRPRRVRGTRHGRSAPTG